MSAQPRVLLLGAVDTKVEQYAYAHRRLLPLGAQPVAFDFGTLPVETAVTQQVRTFREISLQSCPPMTTKMALSSAAFGVRARVLVAFASCLFGALLCASADTAGSNTHVDIGAASEWTAFNCGLKPLDGGYELVDIAAQPVVQRSVKAEPGARVIEFEMRAGLPASEHYVAWATQSATDWRRFVLIPIHLDGEWHSYRLPLNAEGVLKAVRFAFSTEDGEVGIRNLRLSSVPAAQHTQLPVMEHSTGRLKVGFDTATRRYQVADAETGRTWRSAPLTEWAELVAAERTPEGFALHLRSRFSGQTVRLCTAVNADASVTFTATPESLADPLEGLEELIPTFTTELTAGKLIFCDRSAGVLLDQQDDAYADWPLRVYGNTHCLDMPWVGVYDAQATDGVLVMFDTPNDAKLVLRPDDAGNHWPQTRWLASRDSFGYARSVTHHFIGSGGYLGLAKRYRQIAAVQGKIVSLADKATVRPDTNRLRGAASIWSGDRFFDHVREAYSYGVHRGIVSNVRRPSNVAWLKQRGFLVGRYDSYSDIFEGPLGFQRDNIREVAVQARPGAEPLDGWKMEDGRQMSWRSTAKSLRAAESYVPEQIKRTGHNARFVDVMVASKLDEDYAPEHSYDRTSDLRMRRELLSYLRGFGLVLGTEHGNDWATDLVDYHEGASSGPFWWSSWEAGHLKRPRRDQLSAEYLRFGVGPANRLPLWQLVYHDCLVSTPYWGDTAGMLHEGAPDIATRKDLFNLLYGGAPLLWLTEEDKGFGWEANRWRWLRTYHETTHFLSHVAFEPMLSHESLSPDGMLQQTTFGNGARVVVNFGSEPVADPADTSVVLAPLGYRATAPGYSQEKLWIDGGVVTSIVDERFRLHQSPAERTAGGVRHQGRVYLFASNDGAWTVVGEPNASCEINLAGVLGCTQTSEFRVCPIENGDVQPATSRVSAAAPLRFAAKAEGWIYQLTPIDDPPAAVTASAEATPAEAGR